MIEEDVKRSSRRFEFAGAIACAICVAHLQWLLHRDSLEPAHLRDLIRFTVANLVCYLAAFLLVRRYWVGSFKRVIPRWVVTAFGGALLSAHLIDLTSTIMGWGRFRIGEVLEAMLYFTALNSLISLAVMAFICGIGFTARLIQKEIRERKVEAD